MKVSRRAIARPAVSLLVLLVASGGFALASGGATYPGQPSVGAALVCLSETGVTCFHRPTLRREWRALDGQRTFEPVTTRRVVLVGSTSGLYALSPSDGGTQWQWHTGDHAFSPAAEAGMVYATDRAGRIAAIDAGNGQVRWQRRLQGWLYTPALTAGLVITGGRSGVLHALDRATGETVWERELDQELVHRPVALEDGVVVTTFKGTAARFDREGELRWSRHDPSPSFSPATGAGLLVFGGMDGTWRARDAVTGRLLWKMEMSGQLTLPARIHGHTVALARPDGRAVIVNAADGRLLERLSIPGQALAAPVYAGEGTWRLFYSRSGIISWVDASR